MCIRDRNRTVAENQRAALAVAPADFQAVMDVQPLAGDVADMPLFTREHHDGQMNRQLIVAVFHNGFFGTTHMQLHLQADTQCWQ